MKNSIELLFERTSRYPLLTAEEEINLFRLYKSTHDQEVRDRLCYSNVRLVCKIARKWLGKNILLDDLMMEGMVGMNKAIDLFNPELGFRFSTYVSYWIENEIRKYIQKNRSIISIGYHASGKMDKMISFTNEYVVSKGTEPTNEVVAKALGFSLEEVEQLRNDFYFQSVVSLNHFVSENEDDEMIDFCFLEDNNEDVSYNISLDMAIENCMSYLSEREQDVLILRYGLFGVKQCTLKEISDSFGVTVERIRQIEARALFKIKKNVLSNRNIDYSDREVQLEQLCKKKYVKKLKTK